MHEQQLNYYSHILGRNIETLVFGDRGYPVVVLPTTLGSYFEAKDMGLITSASWFIEQGLVQIYCPDSINAESWYNKKIHPAERVRRYELYDRFLNEEFIPQLQQRSPSGKVCMAGPSFGGYKAANFAFKHPEKVSHLFCMSGAFNIKSFLDGFYNDQCFFNNPVDFLPGANQPELWQMNIVLGSSEWDICLKDNLEMSKLLHQKQIRHWLDVRGWVQHDWPLWREMFPHYLSLL